MTEFTVGAIHLNVSNLDKMLVFYQDIIGLQVHEQYGKTAHLGVGESDLLVLTETPDFKRNRRVTGLYHFAILVPNRIQLANSLKRIAETETPIQGLSDHVVSEAIYLPDPDGNGIEIYRDRPRDDWYKDGEFQLATIPMDVNGVMNTLTPELTLWNGLPKGTIMGHIHLHVSAVPQAEAFYKKILGMDVMANIGSATFMSYDGYHHHLGANVWGGRNLRTGDELGLKKYDLHINDADQLDTILDTIDQHGITITESDGHYLIHDPSNNPIALHSA